MRFIDPDKIEDRLKPEWLAGAQRASALIENLGAKERAKKINANSHVWSGLKDELRQVTNGKCWYCESIDDRSDNAVDHFRPKNSVANSDLKEGYWWLAFEWRNYRFCCTFCNSYRKGEGITGGKQDHFPLVDETKRAKGPDDPLEEESPKLLDPMAAGDPDLLAFDETNGEAVPRCHDKDAVDYKRAKESIKRYHLNQERISNRRRRKMREVRKKIKSAQQQYQNRNEEPTAMTAYRDFLAELIASKRHDAEYSAAAVFAVNVLRGGEIRYSG